MRRIRGKTLLAHAITHARAARLVGRVIVSTDSPAYAAHARRHGAETPFLRPKRFARDNSTDLEVFQHALQWLRRHENYVPDIVVHLRPTCPLRHPSDIDAMIRLLHGTPKASAARSVAPASQTPFKMWFMDRRGRLSSVVRSIPEAYNKPRQSLPRVYIQNACIDVTRGRTIAAGSMTGKRIRGYLMDHFIDIDHEVDLRRAKGLMDKK